MSAAVNVFPLYVDPVARAVALRRLRALRIRRLREKHRRQRIEERIVAALEDLRQDFIARLDALHGDCDLEPYGDELEPSEDYEPSLGSMSNRLNQRFWSIGAGGAHDFEAEHDGREPTCEDEGAQQDAEPEFTANGCPMIMHEGRIVWPPPGTIGGSEG